MSTRPTSTRPISIRRRTTPADAGEPLAFTVADNDGPRDIQALEIPASLQADPQAWAEDVFSLPGLPPAIKGLFGLRQLLVPLIGVPRTKENPFRVQQVVDNEALIMTKEPHLTFWVSVGQYGDVLRVATAVQLNGWAGRLYWMPVSLLHGPVTRTMMRGAIKRRARAEQG